MSMLSRAVGPTRKSACTPLRILVAVACALGVLVLLLPLVCGTGEGDKLQTCETILGWSLPGFEAEQGSLTPYLLPAGASLLVLVAVVLALCSRARGSSDQ